MSATVFTAKTIGTFTVGLWAGYNASLIRGDTPLNDAIFKAYNAFLVKTGLREKLRPSECSCTPATHTIPGLKELVVRGIHLSSLSCLALIVHAASFLLAPASGRHPYLLYLALGVPLVGGLQLYGGHELFMQLKKSDGIAEDEQSKAGEEPSDLSESVYEHIPSASYSSTNKDVHQTAIQDKYAIYSHVVSGLSASIFLVNVIGLAGESYISF